MAHIVDERILESTTATGTGNIALAGAVTGFRQFASVCAVGDTVPYFIEAVDSVGLPTGDYEYGVATYSAANTLTRTKVAGSSNGGALVNFAAGSKNVGVPAMGSSLVPVGSVFFFPATGAPAGYVKANGALLSRTQYPALWEFARVSGNMAASDGAWVGGKFSPGDGSTTFRVPDLRGEFLRGLDDGRGVDAGRAIGSAQGDTVGPHTHPIAGTFAATAGSDGTVLNAAAVGTPAGTGVNVGTETRPRNIALLACLKA